MPQNRFKKKKNDVKKKYTCVRFSIAFCGPSLSLAQKYKQKKLVQNCFEIVVSELKKKKCNLALNVFWKKKKLFKS